MYVEVPTLAPDVRYLLDLAKSVDVAPGPGGSRITPAPMLNDAVVLGSFAKLVALYPSAQLVKHCDPPIRGQRFHMPLQMNQDCWVYHDGVWQQLEVGHLYLMDQTKPHGAVNWGAEVRLHLMMDVEA